ncbi:hypothetical protein [Novosphingobium mangrovi (ex Huang et al. 2023)]|uniref:Uncharacterized protein n=1 Tax=Novosphingobium mangrovi (ex Huang et al. 2023) TaxID=2976432 RepID=A0ABT2I118_9SPHN|nr:hypothetical protein [Novosphingobium mangrovi (ex Huang et al. 2023)]MCT2398493.1 hypothetical protein [Novosphingobium mangrovi (ex Huang et al. 2023)]
MNAKRETIGAQGEISIFRVMEMPSGLAPLKECDRKGRPIISHSESGNHHILDRAVDVMEQPDAPAGMRILYAILEEPTMLIQDAAEPHGSHQLPAGIYEFRIAREYDPFTEQARMVAD